MAEDHVEVTNQSWFSRLGSAMAGMLIGLIVFLAAFPLLFWNEGRAVKRYKTLKEGQGAVVSVAANQVEAAHEGKLVHVTGLANTDETLRDAAFGMSVRALRLSRNVKMYQWKELKESKRDKKLGGSTETVTTYRYKRGWTDKLIRSSHFKQPDGHTNPDAMPYASQTFVAKTVTLGAFALPASMARQINRVVPQ